MKTRGLICLLAFALLSSASPYSQEMTPPTGHTRTLVAAYTASPPRIDGSLDDSTWENASLANGFWLSLEQSPPTEQTEVLVLQDEENLYFAFRCYDKAPEEIVAEKTRRDAGLGVDDHVTVELDAFHNYRRVSSYSVNARGTQNDFIAGGRANKIEWKGDWKAAATTTTYGWSAEIAIPYSILNFHAESRSFGINFVRYHHRTDELSRWSDISPQEMQERMGTLSGLDLSNATKKKPVTVMPYLLAGANLEDIHGQIQDQMLYGGADIRYEPSANWTSVFSIDPDFNQLETQITDIDFSYNEKFRRDPRPFFQEGSAYFGDSRNYFYSNRIPNFYLGAKSFAQLGSNAVGGLVTSSPDGRWDAAARFVHEIDPRNTAGAMLVATHRSDLRNQLAAFHFQGRKTSGVFYNVEAAYSNTEGLGFDRGGAVEAAVGWRGDHWTVEGLADYFHQEYFPANGLLDGDLYGTRSLAGAVTYFRQQAGAAVREVSANLTLSARDTWDGRRQNHHLWADAAIELQQQIRMQLSYYDAAYRPVDTQRESFSDTINDDSFWAINLDFNTRSNTWGYGLYLSLAN